MKDSIVNISGHKYRYRYDPESRSTKYLGPLGDSPPITEEDFVVHMRKQRKIFFEDIQEHDMDHGTSFIREMEMDLEIASGHNLPLIQQFFKDLRLYGLNEAILYVEGYERSGEYREGTADKIRNIKNRYEASLLGPSGFEMKPS